MPIVLASNEANATDRYEWKDITGVQYHYPNNYRNLIRTGEDFVYYRGIRRLGGRRAQAEYFGWGVIGDIWRDPAVPSNATKAKWSWYCGIEDYIPFPVAVPAKIGGVFFETSNRWRNGVRELPRDAFDRILIAGRGVPGELPSATSWPAHVELPHLTDVRIEAVMNSLMVPHFQRLDTAADGGDAIRRTVGWVRRSRSAKIVGDRAEEIGVRYIRDHIVEATDIRHVAVVGETPGWDIEYKDGAGNLNAVEVKGTTAAAFISFELTHGELAAARRLGPRYWVYLVANCLGLTVSVQCIQDPVALIEQGLLCSEPFVWRIWHL